MGNRDVTRERIQESRFFESFALNPLPSLFVLIWYRISTVIIQAQQNMGLVSTWQMERRQRTSVLFRFPLAFSAHLLNSCVWLRELKVFSPSVCFVLFFLFFIFLFFFWFILISFCFVFCCCFFLNDIAFISARYLYR